MTAAGILKFSASGLEQYYARLSATKLPTGTFRGQAWSHDVPLVWLANWFWQGKVFTSCECGWDEPDQHGYVRNRIGPALLIRGTTQVEDGEVLIDYPQLQLQDRLRPVSDALWLGQLQLGRWGTVWFTLEQETAR